MGRAKRILIPNNFHHIVNRIAHKEKLFSAKEKDAFNLKSAVGFRKSPFDAIIPGLSPFFPFSPDG